MRLYIECSMGASGDMLMSALYELLPNKESFREKIGQLGLNDVTFEYTKSMKCGITGTHITVRVGDEAETSEDVCINNQNQEDKYSHNHSHSHGRYNDTNTAKNHHKHGNQPIIFPGRNNRYADEVNVSDGFNHKGHSGHEGHVDYKEIPELINSLDLPDNVSGDALDVFKILGEAEAVVHDVAPDDIHLHEVGQLDAVADIVGCCLLINMLGVTDVIVSPIHVGSGSVLCQHGAVPVPAPATAEILKGVPIYGGTIKGELCTPTGAALLKHFAARFGEMPPMTVVKIGYGMGTKDFEAANCLRVFLCEDEALEGGRRDVICEISCNLDDMTPEAIGAVFEILLENGALDVYTVPIMMKKNRPAVMLSCLCAEDKRDKIARLLLENTSTLGARMTTYRRDVLSRSVRTVSTRYGDIRIKQASGFGVTKRKPEYDDVLASAKQYGVPFTTVYNAALTSLGEEL